LKATVRSFVTEHRTPLGWLSTVSLVIGITALCVHVVRLLTTDEREGCVAMVIAIFAAVVSSLTGRLETWRTTRKELTRQPPA
jgi:hypothetical protein